MTLINQVTPVQRANAGDMMLKDIIPARHKLWWHYPGLRTLNLLLLCAVVTDITNGKSLCCHGSILPSPLLKLTDKQDTMEACWMAYKFSQSGGSSSDTQPAPGLARLVTAFDMASSERCSSRLPWSNDLGERSQLPSVLLFFSWGSSCRLQRKTMGCLLQVGFSLDSEIQSRLRLAQSWFPNSRTPLSVLRWLGSWIVPAR